MKNTNTYVCLVDNYRRPSRRRNTYGRYLVGAKTEKEAKEILQKAIGFGSVNVYYKVTGRCEKGHADRYVGYKEILKVKSGPGPSAYEPVKHATEQRKEKIS